MKKILSILLTFAMCISFCSCSKPDAVTTQKADFSRTAGVWYLSGSPNFARLVMDGAGAVESHYPEQGGVEFTGYLGYDAKEDTYAIFKDNDEYVSDFRFDYDTQISIVGSDGVIYTKSDESLNVPKLVSDNALPGQATLDEDSGEGYYYLYLSDDEQITTVNTCFANEMRDDDFIETYIVNCIAELSEDDISDVKIEESAEYTAKIGEHVYIVSWISRSMQWKSFFFMTSTHTYMYSLYAPDGIDVPYESVFDGLHLE